MKEDSIAAGRGGKAHAWLRGNVLGLVAIFIALGGTAFAVQKAPNSSVVSKSIKDGQVKQPDLGDAAVDTGNLAGNAVNSSKVADDSLTSADIDEATLGGVQSTPTGAAGGELAGSYPNPSVGTVAGLDLATHDGPAGGIHFGSDVDLYRDTQALGAPVLKTQRPLLLENSDLNSASILSPNGSLALISLGQPGRGFITIDESTGTPVPPVNTVLFAVRDNAGTTQVIARFPGGDTIVLGQDPNP